MERSRILFLGVLIAALPLAAQAQTNAPAEEAPVSAATNAPAFISATPQVIPSQGAGQGLPQQQEDIEDIRPPFFFLHSWFWLWVALAVLAIVALGVFFLSKFLDKTAISPKTAYEMALEKLEKARALLREENPEPYAVAVSETIRTYLGQRFQTPSSRRTTEEFLRQMESDSTTPLAAHHELLREFLQSCDMVKFARYQPTLSELEQVQQRALTFVTATKPVSTPSQQNGRHP